MKGLMRLPSAVRVSFAQRCGHSILAPLRLLTESRGAQQWVQALENAPCLVCKHPNGHRIDCAVTGFPLTCSKSCDQLLQKEKHNKIPIFRQIHEDLTFTTSDEARTLLSSVLTRDHRAARRGETIQPTQSWEQFMCHFTDNPRWLGEPRAVRLTSAVYTFVATLSNFVAFLRSFQDQTSTELGLHIIGARAEAMMPPNIWGELNDSHEDVRFDIKLVGDHVFSKKNASGKPLSNLCIQNYPGLYHNIIATNNCLEAPPDGYALFNCGIGHPTLRASWYPTLDIILRTGKPVLLTSFSKSDQERDLRTLRKFASTIEIDFLEPPRQNEFQSRCYQLDPLNVYEPVQTNSHFMVVRGRTKT